MAFARRPAACLLGCFAVVALVTLAAVVSTKNAAEFLLYRLTHVRHLPEAVSSHADVVYVLGGTADSLKAKFRIAAKLVRDRRATRVLVLSETELMAYSPALGRNPTVNEWAVAEFGALGVAAGAIEFVALEEGFFGTWSEANGLSQFLRERRLRRLILVTSPLHSRRAWESFSRTVEQPDKNLFLYLSDEPTGRRHALTEYAKLILYRALLFRSRGPDG